MMVQFVKRKNESAGFSAPEEESSRPELVSALNEFEACIYTDTDLQRRLNESMEENKKNEAVIMSLRKQIHRYQAHESSMEAKIIQLSMDLAMAKAEADRLQLKLSQSEQQPQEITLNTEATHAEAGQNIAPLASASRRRRNVHSRSKSLTIPSHSAVQMVDVVDETISDDMGSSTNLFKSMGRHLGQLDSSIRNLRQSVLRVSLNSDSSSEKLNKSSSKSGSYIEAGPFDCDNSAIEWPDV